MSHANPISSSSSSRATTGNFQLIINNALDTYKKRTKKDLLAHPLFNELQSCNSPSSVLSVLHQQLQGLDQSRRNDERWTRWLDPTVNVLYALSGTLGEGVGLVFSPAKVIFAGVGVLLSMSILSSLIPCASFVMPTLQAAKDVRASQDILIDVFERIEMFFRRLVVYTAVPPTNEMMDVIVQIMAEVLSILGAATTEIKQGRMKKYAMKLIGRTKMEDALKKLDKLTHEEARMAAAQNLKATYNVDERVKGVRDMVEAVGNMVVSVDDQMVRVDDRVIGVDDRMAGVENHVSVVNDRVAAVDDQVASVIQRVVTVDDRVKVVDNNLTQVIADGKETKASVQQMADDIDESKRNQLRERIHTWLSPPDPSTNHNIACGTHYKKTATWFFRGGIYQEWKSTGSLLWIHGKPGSGKSVICSTVIQDVEETCKAGNASMSYFYFDFRDANKQGLRDLLTSLLIQISAFSGPCCDILSVLFSSHDKGKSQPSDSSLAEILKRMVAFPDQPPHYMIIDALDESPNTSGISSPRETVLQLVKELVGLSLPNLHICVTSRPEIDIRNVLEPLTLRRVSLHDQSGQRQDIEDYVRSVVYSDSQQIMKRWRTEDKELVINTLSERADGMFRWAFCQLETLRHCLPPTVRRTLGELPESLDETYERVLKEIKKPNRDYAHRLLQCLVVAFRPLEVEELAEVIAVDFDDAEGVPKLNPAWRWEDEEQALLTSCSSLIAIVETDESRLVQFSHFSVKEFMTSTRLAVSREEISRYYIDLEPAHAVLAQACMGVLLRPDDPRDDGDSFEEEDSWNLCLAQYAAQYWVKHARFKSVSSSLKKAMEYLFDLDKPHFATWLRLFNIDNAHIEHIPSTVSSSFSLLVVDSFSYSPLYHAALCGLRDLVEHLVSKYPEHVKTNGGRYGTPLVAALVGRHFQTAKFLHDNGAHLDAHYRHGVTPLQSAAYYGDVEMVRVLLGYSADVHSRRDDGRTALHDAAMNGSRYHNIHNTVQSLPDVVRILLEHGADLNARDCNSSTPLHIAAETGSTEVLHVLLEHGADLYAQTNDRSTPLFVAAKHGNIEVVRTLFEHGADLGTEDEGGRTTLHGAAGNGNVELVRMLIEHNVDINARTSYGSTPLLMAAEKGNAEVVRMLFEHGANLGTEDEQGATPLHGAAGSGNVELVRMLLEHSADVNARTKYYGSTPLHVAVANYESIETVRVLLEHGASVGTEDEEGRTPLHRAARHGDFELVRVLLEHSADVNARTKYCLTPLLMAAKYGRTEAVRVLLEHGASVGIEDEDGFTPLHGAARNANVKLVRMLLEHRADVNARTKYGSTPLHVAAARYGSIEVVRVLVEHGASVGMEDEEGRTPLHEAARNGDLGVVRVLLENSADVNAQTKDSLNPLLMAAMNGSLEVVQVLLEHGANVGAADKNARTSLHRAAVNGGIDLIRRLLEHGADINARASDYSTPLLVAAKKGNVDIIRTLLEHGANVEAEDKKGRTSFKIALSEGYNDVVELLSDHGAKLEGVFSVSTSSLCLPW